MSPNPITSFLEIVKMELYRNILRKRIFIIVAVLAIIIGVPLAIRIYFNAPPPATANVFLRSELDMVDLLIILSATFFAADLIVSEYEKRTGYILFPNPVRREIIFAGKFVASTIITILFVGTYYISYALETVYYYDKIPKEFYLSFAYAILYTLAVIGLAYLFSSILKSSMSATLLTFFLLFMIFPIIQSISMITGFEPWFILTYTSDIITLVFNPPKQRVVKIDAGGFTFYIFYPDFKTSVLVMIAYAIITSLISLYLFKRRELKE